MDSGKQGPPPNYHEPPQVGYPPVSQYAQQGGYSSQYHAQYASPQFGGGTTVIVNQPMPGAAGMTPRMWTTGVCDCCEDPGICLCAAFCYICLSCQTATDLGESACVPCCVPGAEIVMRTKWRTQENIQGSILDDCCTIWCCGPCALCQLAREVKNKKNGTLQPRA